MTPLSLIPTQDPTRVLHPCSLNPPLPSAPCREPPATPHIPHHAPRPFQASDFYVEMKWEFTSWGERGRAGRRKGVPRGPPAAGLRGPCARSAPGVQGVSQ